MFKTKNGTEFMLEAAIGARHEPEGPTGSTDPLKSHQPEDQWFIVTPAGEYEVDQQTFQDVLEDMSLREGFGESF